MLVSRTYEILGAKTVQDLDEMLTHDNGDVSREHEIQLGFWHHGRVPGHSDIQKNQSRKDFPAIKFLFYKIVPISLNFPPDCSSKIDILPFFPQKLRGNIF